ncbi:hypothetical protein ACWDTI_17685 [Gordonia sp. NPDC003424]
MQDNPHGPMGPDPQDGLRGTNPAGLSVSIVGMPPPIRFGTILVGVIDAAAVVGLVFFLVTGNRGGAFVCGLVLLIIGLPGALAFYGARVPVGKPQVTASPEGVWTRFWEFRWDEVIACEFVRRYYLYTVLTGPQQVRPTDLMRRSFVVTTRTADVNGRPQQYGFTLPINHSTNFDEFYSAVRAFAPHVEFWKIMDASVYVVNPATQDAIAREIATTGMVAVRDPEGNPKFAFDPRGVVLKNGSRLGWNDLVEMNACNFDELTNSKLPNLNYGLEFVTLKSQAGKGTPPRLRPDLKPDYTPPIEQLMPTILRWAPHLRYTDSRVLEGKKA